MHEQGLGRDQFALTPRFRDVHDVVRTHAVPEHQQQEIRVTRYFVQVLAFPPTMEGQTVDEFGTHGDSFLGETVASRNYSGRTIPLIEKPVI